jgi:hypothetical protein
MMKNKKHNLFCAFLYQTKKYKLYCARTPIDPIASSAFAYIVQLRYMIRLVAMQMRGAAEPLAGGTPACC